MDTSGKVNAVNAPMDEITTVPQLQSSLDIELLALSETAPPLEPEQPRNKFRLAAILTALYLAMFVTALDQTIVATAIPTITHDLNSASGYVWIGGAYLLSSAASGPIWAKLSDIFGRKPTILMAAGLFFASSISCAKASSMKVLIVGRTFQGVGGGGLAPLVMITISDLFSMRSRSLYMGLMELVWIVAGGAGPVLGGAFTEKLSWRWNFWINLPLSGATFILLFLYLDVHNPRTPWLDGFKAIDWAGSLSIIALVLMLLLGLEFGGATFPWDSPQVICLIVFGSLMSIFFIYSEKRLALYPLMPLKLFTDWSNAASLLLKFWHGMVYIGAEYYLPLYFQSVKGSSPLGSGLLVMPITVTEAVAGVFVGVIIHRTGRYLEIIYVGVLLMTLGNGLYILFSPKSGIIEIIFIQIVAGIGAGLLFQAPLIALQALVSQEDTATATATSMFVNNLATALSVVIGGVLFQNSMDIRITSLALPPTNLPSNITDLLSAGGAAANVKLVSSIQDQTQRTAVREAYAWSLRNVWILYTGISAMAVVTSVFIKKHHLTKDHTETKTGLKSSSQDLA
ncbi:MFS-type transporter [Lachnellula hyalina]|uniref:Efflux pump dotC n=1 Tax=Lachnellula hyalina TaxID=1316788 RepID=A0A8H8QVV6_9HELO|nr:MFS-type transporter [Lachnellula hyalina]TVY23777.1 MFS-type transporter [Lachnellula hyalina]